jgi:threonyl-tRNA synthetase
MIEKFVIPSPLEGAEYVPEGYDETLYRIRHSAAHVMAEALCDRFRGEGSVSLAIGPPVEDGFYYDVEVPRALNEADLDWLETRMKGIIRGAHIFEISEVSADDARGMFKDNPYKLEILDGLLSKASSKITIYRQDGFVDLCRGPHVRDTGEINPDAIKLLNVSGSYWRGDESRPMLQRIYGTAWQTPEQLSHYLWRRSEAEKRDHRLLGKQLELFHLDPTAPGMPYWLPKGFKVLTKLIDFWRVEHEQRGYQEIASPLINEKRLWEVSGHWDHYKDNMFIIPIGENVTYAVKPMNCPNAMVVYNLKTRSYRDLPFRLSDCDTLHRNERSGTLHGLLRVQKFQQDDAHIFVTENQIEEEYNQILDIVARFYNIFNFAYSLRLGTRPEKFIGDIETWNQAEAALTRILDKHSGQNGYTVASGDGAFYGPKIDILMEDALGRSWQMGTIQLDFQLPRRFKCAYIDRDGHEKTPVVIHRVIYGSLERFIGILIEHTKGAFPFWLAPVQAQIIPIADRHNDYARGIAARLGEALRVELDESDQRMNAKIRHAQMQKIPYMLVVGDRELAEKTISVRSRGGKNMGAMSIEAFLGLAQDLIVHKRFDLEA